MNDKTKLKTYKKIEKNLENIFVETDITIKERHGGLGLTIKLFNDFIDNNQPFEVNLNNSDITNNNNENFKKNTYLAFTILENKEKINVKKKIFNLEKQLKSQQEKEQNLKENLNIINYIISGDIFLILRYIYLKLLYDDVNKIEWNKKTQKNINDSELIKLYYFKEEINRIKLEITNLKNEKEKIVESLKTINLNVQKLKDNIDRLKYKINKNTDDLTVSLSLKEKISKLRELQKKFYEDHLTTKTKENILQNISMLEKKIVESLNDEGKKIKEIYEEILPIDNNYYYVTTFVHANQSITEEVTYFDNNDKNELIVKTQTKYYQNLNKYKKKVFLIDEKNRNINTISIKEFINQQTKFKFKPSKAEFTIWVTIMFLTISISIIFVVIPIVWLAATIVLVDKLVIGLLSVASAWFIKTCTSMFSTATNKVDRWFCNRWFFTNKVEKAIQRDIRKQIIKNLTSDKIETKLEAQFNILKEELDNRKNKKADELLSNKTILQNENVINFNQGLNDNLNNQEWLNIEEINAMDWQQVPTSEHKPSSKHTFF